MKKIFQIAIDGPVAAGKGTVGRILSQKLGILYLDSGAMYRTVAFLGIKNGIDLKDEEKLISLLKKIKLKIKPSEKGDCLVFLNGKNISEDIRVAEIDWGASVVATLPKVRKLLVKKQKEIARGKSVIIEGRDITTKVLPNANLKIYLTADLEERAKRKLRKFAEKGIVKSFSEVLEEVKKRDYQDMNREIDPLTISEDSWVLDTTNLTIDKVVEKILEKIKELQADD